VTMKFEEGKILTRLFLEKRGKMLEIIIRYPKKDDVKKLRKFINFAMKETEFIGRYKQIKTKDEKKWLSDVLIKMKKKKTALIIAEHDGIIIGSSDIKSGAGNDVRNHVGSFGIVILKKYWGLGLGTKMMDLILGIGKKDLHIEMAQLSVYGKNKKAQNLYMKMGFCKIGVLPNGVKMKGKYDDDIFMYKVLK
jgi:RimJ/RimL family protein N-acetyltransferase